MGLGLGRGDSPRRGLLGGRVHGVQGCVVDHLAEARLVLLDLQLEADAAARLIGLDGRLAGPLGQEGVVLLHRRAPPEGRGGGGGIGPAESRALIGRRGRWPGCHRGSSSSSSRQRGRWWWWRSGWRRWDTARPGHRRRAATLLYHQLGGGERRLLGGGRGSRGPVYGGWGRSQDGRGSGVGDHVGMGDGGRGQRRWSRGRDLCHRQTPDGAGAHGGGV